MRLSRIGETNFECPSIGHSLYNIEMLSTSQKGHLALLAAEQRAITTNCILSKPTIEGCLYDCIIDKNSQLYRCQVKYADGKPNKRTQGSVVVSLSSWSGRSKSGKTIRKGYTKSQIDVFIVFVPKINEVLWIPVEIWAGKSKASIRLSEAKNTAPNFTYAKDYIWSM